MALPDSDPSRKLQHRRRIDVEVFSRDDGLWEVDARLTDTKTRDARLGGGVRPAGEPIHDLLLRLVIDERFNVVEAGSDTRAMPYPGSCDDLGDAYGRLVGLNLMHDFRRAVRHRLGGIEGCTHLTEMSQTLPTAVVQAFAGIVIDTRGNGSERPFQIDRCRALRADGAAVREHYPRWFRQAAVSTRADTCASVPGAPPVLSPLQESTP